MAKKSSDQTRLPSAIMLPESIINFMLADKSNRDQLLASRVKPKDVTWAGVLQHAQQRLVWQQLQTDYVQLLYALWEKVWLEATMDCNTQEKLEQGNLWNDAALWRQHTQPVNFSTGIIFDITSDVPELQLAIYCELPTALDDLATMGWKFDEGWESFVTEPGLLPVSVTEGMVDIQLLQECAAQAIYHLKTLPIEQA